MKRLLTISMLTLILLVFLYCEEKEVYYEYVIECNLFKPFKVTTNKVYSNGKEILFSVYNTHKLDLRYDESCKVELIGQVKNKERIKELKEEQKNWENWNY